MLNIYCDQPNRWYCSHQYRTYTSLSTNLSVLCFFHCYVILFLLPFWTYCKVYVGILKYQPGLQHYKSNFCFREASSAFFGPSFLSRTNSIMSRLLSYFTELFYKRIILKRDSLVENVANFNVQSSRFYYLGSRLIY